jgi:hypothetical protein
MRSHETSAKFMVNSRTRLNFAGEGACATTNDNFGWGGSTTGCQRLTILRNKYPLPKG